MNPRAAAERLAAGHRILVCRLVDASGAWCRRSYRHDLTGWRAALGPWLRLVVLAAAGWALLRMIRAAPACLWLLASVWCVAAWRSAPLPEAATIEPEAEPEPDVDQGAAEEAFRQFVRDAIGDRNGVHLSTLLALLHQAGMHPTWRVEDIGAACRRLGIPVRPSVKVGGTVRTGVHRADLPPTSPAETPASPGTTPTAA